MLLCELNTKMDVNKMSGLFGNLEFKKKCNFAQKCNQSIVWERNRFLPDCNQKKQLNFRLFKEEIGV